MKLRPPRSTRTDTRLPYTTLCRYLALPRRGEAQHVLRAIMPKVMPLVTAEHHAVIGKQTGPRYFAAVRPPRRAERLGLLGLSRPPDRHGDGDDHRKDSTRRGDIGAGQEDVRRVGEIGRASCRERVCQSV